MRRPVILLPILLVLAVVVWFLLPFLLPNTSFYQRRRPTRLGKTTNRVMSLYSSLGLPPAFLAGDAGGERTAQRPCPLNRPGLRRS